MVCEEQIKGLCEEELSDVLSRTEGASDLSPLPRESGGPQWGGVSGTRRLDSCQLSLIYIFNSRDRHTMGWQLKSQAGSRVGWIGHWCG